jgi:NAD(P)-dependent dehydrogenase (short-subunit alcohol dehydrogenase family)
MRGLRDKRVLVSGGSSGIGRATAQRFLEEGCRVTLGGLEEEQVRATVADLSRLGDVSGMAVDVSDERAVAQLVAAAVTHLGGIDVLVNNAGTAWRRSFLDLTAEEWDRMLSVNLRGMFLVAQAASVVMVEQGQGGAIVNMSSTNGLAGEADYAHYNASKGGVLLLTRTMALELAPHRIRVNALCPGWILTPLNATISEGVGSDSFVARYVEEKIPLGRTGRSEDVAAAYAFLASDEAAFITGTELVVDGGQLAGG